MNQIGNDFEEMRREMDVLRAENQRMFQEMNLYRQQQNGVAMAPAPPQQPQQQAMPPPAIQHQQRGMQQPLPNGPQQQQQQQQQPPPPQQAPPMVHSALPQHPGPQHFSMPPQSDPGRSLPPLTNGVPSNGDMQGVQYS